MNDISPLEESQILTWLQQHPDFFTNHPELLPAAIHASGKVLSLEVGQLNHLRRQNDQLRGKLDIILERIRRNEEIYRTFHAIKMQLIMVADPWSLIVVATGETEKLFDIQRVTVSLSAKEKSLVSLFQENPQPELVDGRLFVLEHTLLSQVLGDRGTPTIRVGLEGENRHLYFGETVHTIRSEVLVPLRAPAVNRPPEPRILGSLNFGGASPSRFLPSDATDLLQDLSDILSLCLMRMVDA